MEFHFNINNAMNTIQVLKIGHTLSAVGHEKNHDLQNTISFMIDEMGKMSAIAQKLQTPITSANKLRNSDEVLYMMTEHNTPKNFAVVGILKMGWKKLKIFDKSGSQSDVMVYCLSDFYIEESKQRKGYGKYLIDYMLKDMNLEAHNLALEKPFDKLVQFMRKHFQLTKLINQENNNFAVFEEFFNNTSNENMHDDSGNRVSAYNQQPTFGRHGAHKHHDTMGEIVQGVSDTQFKKLKYNHEIESFENQYNEEKP